MPQLLLVGVLLLFITGCTTQPHWQPQQPDLFAPTAMRIHPVFTQIRDWTESGQPDGVEVMVEFQDRFGDPSKASGAFVFELFQYRPGFPDQRGARVAMPFVANVDSAAAQRDHWNRTARSYAFQLALPQVNPNNTYVLQAHFELTGGGRFTDTLVLTPPPRAP
jgi:hypothetical protein